MDLSDFDFPFDTTLIADRPVEPRDEARLLVVPREGGPCAHRHVQDLADLLQAGDLLIVNDTKVMAVRLSGRKRPGGGRLDVVLVKALADRTWEALIQGRVRPGDIIEIASDVTARVVERGHTRSIIAIDSDLTMNDLLARYGHMPLPPYVKRKPSDADRQWYQTIFAREEGAIAAPTAGLHFTEGLLRSLQAAGIGLATVTLHVGAATFKPVTAECVTDHVMQPERCLVSEETCLAISKTKARGGRVVAVGTTVVRTLEAVADDNGRVRPFCGDTNLFILPGFSFRVIDGLMTNFHLPRTTLVMLVSAYLGRERLLDAYREALLQRYRFYSYGDAMLIV